MIAKTAQQRGKLKDTIETEKEIEMEVANALIIIQIYKFYKYDERIKAKRYLLENMEKNLGLPQWIHIYD